MLLKIVRCRAQFIVLNSSSIPPASPCLALLVLLGLNVNTLKTDLRCINILLPDACYYPPTYVDLKLGLKE